MSKCLLFASLLAVLFTSGCATLFQGNSEEIMVESDPPGALVSVNDGRQGTTPYSLKTNRNDDLDIHVSKPGFSSEDIADTTHVEWGYLVSDLFFTGLVGLAIDGIDGAMFYHNQTMVSAHLEPVLALSAPPVSPSAAAAVASDQPRTYSRPVAVPANTVVNPNVPTNQPPAFE